MSVTAAEGFVAAGCHAGIKHRKHDMALIATDDRRPVTAVGVFTQNKFVAPPVVLDRTRLAASGGRAAAIIVNSGNANAGTGAAGMADAEAMGRAAADALGIDQAYVLVSSTGIIGTRLPLDRVESGVAALAPRRGTALGLLDDRTQAAANFWSIHCFRLSHSTAAWRGAAGFQLPATRSCLGATHRLAGEVARCATAAASAEPSASG